MAHLKHSGPVRIAAHAKRAAPVEILSDETAANDGDLSEGDLLEIDKAYESRKSSGRIADEEMWRSHWAEQQMRACRGQGTE